MVTLLRVGGGRSGGQVRGRSITSTLTDHPSVVTFARAGNAPHAGKKQHHRSARAEGITAIRTTLRLALAAHDRELRVERARSVTVAAQHVTAASGGPACRLGNGQLSHDDRCFFPTNQVLGPVADRIGLLHCAKRMVTRGCKGEEDTTLLLVG